MRRSQTVVRASASRFSFTSVATMRDAPAALQMAMTMAQASSAVCAQWTCAPAAMVDGKLVGRVDEAKIDALIGGLK